jgi:hypothetical protein
VALRRQGAAATWQISSSKALTDATSLVPAGRGVTAGARSYFCYSDPGVFREPAAEDGWVVGQQRRQSFPNSSLAERHSGFFGQLNFAVLEGRMQPLYDAMRMIK